LVLKKLTSSKQSKKQYYDFNKIYQKILNKNFTVKEARELQRFISQNLNEVPLSNFKLVAGIDSSYYKNKIITSIVFYDVSGKKIVYQNYLIDKVNFPYIPTLLFLREGPLHVRIIVETELKADAYLIDGHGKAHPLRAGLASFVGYFSKMPTIGVAKSKLFGSIEWSNNEGNIVAENEIIGKVIKLCNRNLYISVGCNIDLESSVNVFKASIVGCECYPLTKAHELCTKIANDIKEKSIK